MDELTRKYMDELTKKYIEDPNTRVFISHNDETGVWYYSVVVDNSRGFWLDSFDTEKKAMQYIRDNKLVMCE